MDTDTWKQGGKALMDYRISLGPHWSRAYVAGKLRYGVNHYAKIEQGTKRLTERAKILLQIIFSEGEKENRKRRQRLAKQLHI